MVRISRIAKDMEEPSLQGDVHSKECPGMLVGLSAVDLQKEA